MTKTVALLGSTGSIGTQTLQSIRRLQYKVSVLAANRSASLLEQQAREFTPRCVVISDKNTYLDVKTRLADTDIQILAGSDGMCEAAQLEENDIVFNALVGMVGLLPTLAALEAKKTLALANKETLVAGGQLVMRLAAENQVAVLPVDSEHSAIFQSLQGSRREDLQKVILTASGGPFLGKTKEELRHVIPDQALRHPNWQMGPKVTIDSSTLMNKGLELIEAMWLFSLSPDEIEVVIHPQSVLHSAVQYRDGAVIAQLGVSDMAVPIQYALTYPAREKTDVPPLSLSACASLTFSAPDLHTFSCLDSCMKAARRGGLFPCAVNSANEKAVELFLQGKIGYLDIAACIERVLTDFSIKENETYTLKQVMETDRAVREAVTQMRF